jgi:hypothetical protein
MDLQNFYQVQGRFPCAVAIVALSFGECELIGECFLLVENTRAFLGFQRRLLPQDLDQNEALAHMLDEVRRVYRKMVKAAERYGLLPAGGKPENWHTLLEVSPDVLPALWERGIFTPHLQWIGRHTASLRLRAQIADTAQTQSALTQTASHT